MGRPRTFDRDAALDQAMCLFWARGFEQTSIADLTQELGISAPSLYAAFSDKRSLFEEAVERYEASPRSVTTAGTRGTSEREVLTAMFDAATQEYASGEHPRGCLVNSAPELAVNRAQNRATTAARLREVADDDAAGCDPETLADFAHVLLVGLSSYARDGADEEHLRRVTDLALRAVSRRPRQDHHQTTGAPTALPVPVTADVVRPPIA
ncbi:TetR/AcrR family transcriptional regulator [Sanguibacter antarcticus]|uniref:TetR family transcriptional regulator n=1 Tax=Sanguibacter antarcticus TaxID=372484 RepID=A0A2A9E6U5_9MICO|nr:TetR/AcrR family transcriptional regulator [Sanguibacter antarcticus]PFG33929.1 TetR family transcriptional regulator [Sanguibacter antarcticus]